MKIAISACLLGDNVTWRGDNNYDEQLNELLKGHDIIKICPEVMGGMTIPRHPCEIVSSDPLVVKDDQGNDCTHYYLKGAYKAYDKVKDADFVIIKANSPSCGNCQIYDGTFSHRLITGQGVFAKILNDHSIRMFNENQIEDIKAYIKELSKR